MGKYYTPISGFLTTIALVAGGMYYMLPCLWDCLLMTSQLLLREGHFAVSDRDQSRISRDFI